MGAILSLVNVGGLQLEYSLAMHKGLVVPALMYGNETVVWREKEQSRIRVV